jgi:predicted MFS family arabinose efflux permease
MAVMWAADRMPLASIGWLGGIVVAASTLVLLWFPAPAPSPAGSGLTGTARDALRNIARTSRQPQVLSGFVLFLAPASCAAAINLFAALGNDFHADAEHVIWTTGAGAAMASTIGSLLGGHLADRIDRGVLYLGGGLLVGVCALAMAMAPHTPVAFVVGVLAYNGLAGVCYAGCSALALQLVGPSNPTAASQIGLFFAASNLPIVYMTYADGLGFRASGVHGLLLVDGAASLAAATALLMFWLRRTRTSRAGAD